MLTNFLESHLSMGVRVCVCVCVCVCCWMSVQREKRCLVALPKKSASSSLLHLSLYLSLPSPNKLCHLSYLLELHKERYVGPQLASNMKDVRYNVRRCNTLRRVAELLEKRESAKPANVTGRFDAISVWPTEQVMARRARGGGWE